VQHLNRTPPTLAPRCPDAPMGLVELVERMLDKEYEARPTANDVQIELDKLRPETVYMSWADEGTAPRPRIDADSEARTVLLRPPIVR
jgi:hypothetical protein